MKKLAVAGLVLTASLVFAPVAFAQQSPAQAPSSGCGAALVALTKAEKAAADATAADKAADDAKKADDALANANDALNAARTAALGAGLASTDLNAATLKALRDARASLLAIPAESRTDEQVNRLATLERQIPLVEAFLTAQAAVTTATAAAESDADALRRTANLTDALALVEAAKKAEVAADKACGRNDGQPVRFENCDEVRAAGRAPLPASDPDYRVGLDRDRDGIACEANENTVTPTPSAPKLPTAIATGLAA